MNYKIVKLQGLDSQNFISQQYYKNRDLSERSYKEQNIYFVKDTTDTITREKQFIYSFLSSLRQKINKPVSRKKN